MKQPKDMSFQIADALIEYRKENNEKKSRSIHNTFY
jgi:hypothetical protein